MMNRSKYLKLRDTGIHLLYEHYILNFNVSKHKYMLNQYDFISYLSRWCDVDELYRDVVNYYDSKHNVITLSDSNNQFIKYI